MDGWRFGVRRSHIERLRDCNQKAWMYSKVRLFIIADWTK
jgi:hypothetical protein